MVQVAISLSVIFGLLSSEFLGIASGGLISAGYLSLYFNSPLRLLSTLALSLVVYLVVRLLDQFIFLFGRRRFALCILLSTIGSWVVQQVLVAANPVGMDLRVIGYMIPGLMANDMLRQGVFKTLAMVVAIACLILLISLIGSAI
ncbi:MAG: poly-gamma-glutamate biosynthesis protein PgsC [Spirochaetales bacterium]|nr:poly-gamma-glutamate biosynthesis protein PgsC [Spirochaetales bacterium]